MKSRLLFISLFVFLISCGQKDDRIKVEYWAHGGLPNMNRWVKARVIEFNATHPDIKVNLSQKSWNMIRELLYTNFSTGTGPDVMRVHANYAAEFGEGGHYYPVNKFPDFEEVKSWYLPNLFESVRYKDNYYGLPGSALAFVLVCNKDMFDKEGLKPPRTWSEFRSVAKKMTKDTNGDGKLDQWGLVLLGGDRGGFSYRLAPFIYKAGGDILSEDLTQVKFNSEVGVEALKLFADMFQIDKSIHPGFLAYTISEINDLFCSNKVAMSIEGPWFSGIVEEKRPGKDFYIVPVPVPDDRIEFYDTAPTLQDMLMIAISAHSKNLEAAWEFTKFIRNEEADMAWMEQDMGGFPTTEKALNRPEGAEFKGFEVFKHELQHARPWPAHPKMIAIARNVIAPFGQKGIIGELSPKQAMDEAAKQAQAMLEEMK